MTLNKTYALPMRLMLMHGRNSPTEEMNDWGFQGPTLDGVEAVHFTYGLSTVRVWFVDVASREKAQEITGWEECEDNALEMQFHEDLVMAQGKYYGDWEVRLFDEAEIKELRRAGKLPASVAPEPEPSELPGEYPEQGDWQ